MTQPTTAPAETPSLAFRPDQDEPTRRQAIALYDAYQRGEPATVRAMSLDGARIVGRTSTGPVLRFVLFSEGVKRDGSEVMVDGLDLTNIQRNPRVVWAHQYDIPPIGNWVRFEKSVHPTLRHADGSRIKVLFADAAPLRTTDGTEHLDFARMVFSMYENHDLAAVSGGWNPLPGGMEPITHGDGGWAGFRFTKSDVLEGSFVPIPADPDALQHAISRGVIPPKYIERFVANRMPGAVYVLRDATPAPDPAAPAEVTAALEDAAERATEKGAQDQAVALYANESAATGGEAREHATEEVPPMTIPNADTIGAALRDAIATAVGEAVRDLPLTRKGAVLSQKNKTAITAAMTAMHDALSTLEDVMTSAMGDMGGDGGDMAETATATPAETRDDMAETVADLERKIARMQERENAEKKYRESLARVARLETRLRSTK